MFRASPDIRNPTVPWGKALTETQLHIITILGDIIIPEDNKSPKSSDLKVGEFINEWLSAPYPQQQKDKRTILGGLDIINKWAFRRYRKPYTELSNWQQFEIFSKLSRKIKSRTATRLEEKFFKKITSLFVGGYYTTLEGMADIGYVGNVPLVKFDGPPSDIRKRLRL